MPTNGKGQKDNKKTDFQKFLHKFESMILTSQFKPRERLVEANISEIFGVSRYWVRDAFKVLETKGLVTVIPYKGVIVSELSVEEVEEIFVIRVALERLAWTLAMENATKEDIAELKELTAKFAQTQQERDVAGMVEADANFHAYVLDMTRNKHLQQLVKDLRNRCHILRYSAWSSPDVQENIVEEHRRFVDAVEAKDEAVLMELAERHIGHAKRHYLFRLKTSNAL